MTYNPQVFLLKPSQGVLTLQDPLQVLGQLRHKVMALQADWVDEAQCLGMESRPVELFKDNVGDTLPAEHFMLFTSTAVKVLAPCF